MRGRVRLPGCVFVLAALLAALIASSSGAGATYPAQQGSRGVDTFRNYHNASEKGPRIEPRTWVEVSCKVYDPTIESVNPDGYWYRIASSPWDNEYYSPANTFMNGDPWGGPYTHNTDFSIPDCGSAPAPTAPPTTARPAATPSVHLAQGPPGPSGYHYAVTLDHFPPNTVVAVDCMDSVSPSGFYPFELRTDGNGSASTSSQCYSGDGPDHWVVVDGRYESNHVSWGASPPARPPAGIPPATTSPPPSSEPSPTRSVFFSGTPTDTGLDGLEPGTLNLPTGAWSRGDCSAGTAVAAVGSGTYSTLAGWSLGRLGPIYFLMEAAPERRAQVHRVVLFDPGALSDMEDSWWEAILNPSCDPKVPISEVLADWLESDPRNRLLVFTGAASAMKPCGDCEPRYDGLWKYYLAGLWNQPFADRSVVCNYDDMGHEDVLWYFAGMVKSSEFGCPAGPGRTEPWHP